MSDREIKLTIESPEDVDVRAGVYLKKWLTVEYLRVFTPSLMDLALDRELNGTDLRVLLLILSQLEYENYLNMTQQDLAKTLRVKQPEIAKSIKKLVAGGYLQIVGQMGRQNVYRLNPHLAFRSRAKNYDDLCEAWEDDIGA